MSKQVEKFVWRPNFSHFGWEMTKISTVPKTMSYPENDVHDCIDFKYGRILHIWKTLFSISFLSFCRKTLFWNRREISIRACLKKTSFSQKMSNLHAFVAKYYYKAMFCNKILITKISKNILQIGPLSSDFFCTPCHPFNLQECR